MIQKHSILNAPLYNIKVLVLVPMPVPRGDEIIIVNRFVLELGWIVGRLNLHDAATFRWLCPESGSPTVPLLESFIVGSDGALELRSHLELRRDINYNVTGRSWRGSRKGVRSQTLIRREAQTKETTKEAVFKCEKRGRRICVTELFQICS